MVLSAAPGGQAAAPKPDLDKMALTATTTARRDPLLPKKRHTGKDMARARSAALRTSDLGGSGWKADFSSSPDTPVRCKTFKVDEHDLVETGEAESSFERGVYTVGSEVDLYQTSAMVATSWRRAVRPGFAECQGELAARALADPSYTVRVKSASQIPYPKLAPGTAAYHLVITLESAGIVISMYGDSVYLRDGRALAGVFAIGVDKPFAKAELLRLATLTARRMS